MPIMGKLLHELEHDLTMTFATHCGGQRVTHSTCDFPNHVSAHWQQNKCQLWANCFMSWSMIKLWHSLPIAVASVLPIRPVIFLTMSPRTDNRINANYGRIASWIGAWFNYDLSYPLRWPACYPFGLWFSQPCLRALTTKLMSIMGELFHELEHDLTMTFATHCGGQRVTHSTCDFPNHVSVHWQQNKCQLWANCFMSWSMI